MLDHVSIIVSDTAAERFCDANMKALDVVKVGRRDNWLGYGERARAAYPERVYIAINKGPKPEEGSSRHGVSRQNGGPRSMRSGMRVLQTAAATMARRACAIITRRSSGIPTQPDRSGLPPSGMSRS